MAFSWYVEKEGRQLGPYSSAQLKQLASSGQLRSDDTVRRADQGKVVAAGKVKGLFPEGTPSVRQAASPPPLPPNSGRPLDGAEPAPTPEGMPPLPSDKSRLDGLGAGLRSFGEASKAAARLAAAQARKTHLEKVTLPAAYGALGRDTYASDRFREEFPDLYAGIGDCERQIEQVTSARPHTGPPRGLADRAAGAAAELKVKGQAKALSLKKESLLRRLGESSYDRHGETSGSEPLVRSIIDGLSKGESIDEEILRLSEFGQGSFVTPKRILIGTVGLVILGAVVVARSPSAPGDRGGVEGIPARASEGASTTGPATEAGIHPAAVNGPTAGNTGAMMPVIDRPLTTMKTEYRVERLSFSPDGKLLAVNDELWHVPSRRRLTQGDGGPEFGAAISFSPDGDYLACANRSVEKGTQDSYAELRVFRVGAAGVELARKHRIGTKLSDGFWHTTLWSPGAKYLAVVSGEVLTVIADPTGNPREKMIVHPSLLEGDVNGLGRLVGGFPCYVAGLAFSPDETTLVLAFHERGIYVFGLPGCSRLTALPFPGSDGDWEWSQGLKKATVGYSSDGRFLVTRQDRKGHRDERGEWVSSSESLVVWDTTTWRAVRTITGSGGEAGMVAQGYVGLLPKGRRGLIYPNEGDPRLLLWDAMSGERVETIRPPLIPRRTTDIAWSRPGSRVMLAQVQGPIEVWDIDSKRPVAHIRDELADHRAASAISPDGSLIATGYPNGEVALWDAGAPGRPESLGDLAAEAGRIRHDDDRQMELRKARPPFRSSDVSIEEFLTMVGRSGEVKNPRKGLPILITPNGSGGRNTLRAALGEPTNVISSFRERMPPTTHEILDYACSDGHVLLSVTYDGAGVWIKEVGTRHNQ